jgi:hypothetical protein
LLIERLDINYIIEEMSIDESSKYLKSEEKEKENENEEDKSKHETIG